MTRPRIEGSTEDAPYLRLKQLGKDVHVKISDTPLDLEEWPGRVSLLSVNNKFGYFAAGTNKAFIVSPIQSLREFYGSEAMYEPQYLNTLYSPPVILKFTSDGEKLIVGTQDGRIGVYSTPRNSPNWSAASSSNAAALPLLHGFSHSSEPVRDILPNPHDRPETVAILRGSSDSSSSLELLNTESYSVQPIGGGAGAQFQTAACWSPKGKQIVIGDRSGQLIQYGLDGDVKASIAAPDAGQAREVVSVAWLENSIFVVAYRSPEDGEDLPLFIINHDSKAGITTEVTIEDPAPPFGMQSREPARTFVHIRSWEPTKHILFVSDAPSDEVGVVAYMEGDIPRWVKLDLDDTARASAPLTEDGSPTSIVGMDLDLTSTDPIRSDTPDEEPTPAAPILLTYTTEGTLIAYHVLNTMTPNYPNMLPFDASRIRDPSPSPAKVTTTVPTAASAATTLLPFGATSTSGPKPSFGFGASVPGFGSTGFGSTTPTVTPNKPAFGQPAFGSATPAFGTTPKATFGAPAFGTPTTTPAFGKPAFGQTSFGAATTTPAFTGFGGVAAQQTPFGQAGFNFSSTTPIQTPPTVGASGSGNAASRPAGSKVPGLDSPGPSPPATPVPKVPAPNFGTSSFGSFNPSSTTPTTTPSFSSAAAQPKLSGDILPSSGAFGQTSGATSAFGAFGNPSKRPEFSLPKSDTPASSTATPTFGSTTAFGSSGGFGSSSIPKPSASIQPVKVGAGGGFAGFGSSSGFGGFGPAATKAGTQNIFGGTSSAPPAIKVETSTSPTTAFSAGNGSKPFSLPSGPGAARGTKDTVEDDDEPDRLERFPESENENKEPTQTNLDFLSAPSRSVSAGASPSSFSFMSLGTARPQSQASTPGIQTAFAPATLSKSPQSAIPMSTTTTLFPGPITPTATSPARTPMQEEKPITPATDQDEVEESEDPTEDGEGEGEEAEEGQEEEEPFVVSAPQSSDEEEEGSGTDEEEEPSAGTDSSYVFAEAPKGRSPSADGNTTPRADRRSSPADSTTPVSSPVRPNPEPASSSLPSPPYGANRSEMPSVGFSFGRPNQGVRGKSPFPSAPAVSSPLANPPISGPSPTKSAAEQSEPPEAPFPSLFKQTGKAIQMPMPADDDNKKPATRPGTPPLLFGGGLSKPKPSTASGPSSESQTPALFGVPPSRIPVPKEAIKSSPDVGAPKPLFGSSSPSFSFGAVNSTPKPATSFAFGQAPPPVTSKSTPPPSGFVGFGQPITLGSTASTSLPSRIPVPLNATPAPQPKTPENDMEAMFVRTIDEMAENLDTLRKQVSEARARQLQLKHPKAPQSFNRDLGEAANWSFSDLRSVSSVALSLQTDIEIADKNIKEMMRQIALISTISQKTENQHEEIRRLLEAVRDPRTTELAYKRQLSPEQQGSQARLRYLYEIVKARVEQLELIVEGEKSKVERAKAGRTSIQVPTLELVTRSLKRVTTGAKARLEELESLQRRIEILAIAGDEPLNDSPKGIRQSPSVPPASLSISLPAVGPARTASFTSIKGKGARNSVDFEARAAAAAALHAETCASMLKDAMRVRATETAPWTRCTRVKESSGPSIRRGVTLRRPTQPRRSQMATHSTPDGPSRQTKSQILTTPNGSGSHGQTSSLFGRKSEASLFGSRVDSSPGLGIKPAPRPSLGSGPPPKIRPLSMPARRGYGMNFDDD